MTLSTNVTLFKEHSVNLASRVLILNTQRAKMKSVIQHECSLYVEEPDKGERALSLGQNDFMDIERILT